MFKFYSKPYRGSNPVEGDWAGTGIALTCKSPGISNLTTYQCSAYSGWGPGAGYDTTWYSTTPLKTCPDDHYIKSFRHRIECSCADCGGLICFEVKCSDDTVLTAD